MLNRLSRILLALVTGFVFIGQMEAAAEHCAGLAAAEAAEESNDAPPCHATEQAAIAAHHGGMTHGNDVSPGPSPDSCDCIAVLKICADLTGSSATNHAEPYAWLAAVDTDFASAQPDPDLRPPRS